ncbi:hypothetical protein V8C86DRAFT_2522363 [Haematococcus lacustris]
MWVIWKLRGSLCAPQRGVDFVGARSMGAVVGPKPKAKQRDQRGPPPQDAAAHYLSYVQVLATDVDHNSPSLLLFLDKEGRYLFNAGEGLQRMFRENKLRMQKAHACMHTCSLTTTSSHVSPQRPWRACRACCCRRAQAWQLQLMQGVCYRARAGRPCPTAPCMARLALLAMWLPSSPTSTRSRS